MPSNGQTDEYQILSAQHQPIRNKNSNCLNDMFKVKTLDYALRKNVNVVQPKRKMVTFGLRSVSYLGAKLWNDNPVHIGKLSDVDDHLMIQMSDFINDTCVLNSISNSCRTTCMCLICVF